MNATPLANAIVRALRDAWLEAVLTLLRRETDRALVDLIRRCLALPFEKRINSLRVRITGGGSHL